MSENQTEDKQISSKSVEQLKENAPCEDKGKLTCDRIVVVSDVHLGGLNSNQQHFCEFLEWVQGIGNGEVPISCKVKTDKGEQERSIKMKSPDELILLGDLLELWDPFDDNRNYTTMAFMKPFSLLQRLKCKKVYVTGNHDEDVNEIVEISKDADKKNIKVTDDFEIWKRHYPKKSHYINVGKNTFFFMHGHQFDVFQIFRWISDKIHYRFDPIDWMQDLSNVSYSRKIGKEFVPTFFLIIVGIVFGLLSYFLYGVSRFEVLEWILGLLWTLSAFFLIVSILPRVCTGLQTKIWERFRGTKGKTVDNVLKDKKLWFWKYYKPVKGDGITARTVVFGHTHLADKGFLKDKRFYYNGKSTQGDQLFLNTGHWTNEKIENDTHGDNTFTYIDEQGIYIMRWKGADTVEYCDGVFWDMV